MKKLIEGILLGSVAGLIVSVLFSPYVGEKNRDVVKSFSSDTSKNLGGFFSSLKKSIQDLMKNIDISEITEKTRDLLKK